MSWQAAADQLNEKMVRLKRENRETERYAGAMERRLEHIRYLCKLGKTSDRPDLLELLDIIEEHAKVRDDRELAF